MHICTAKSVTNNASHPTPLHVQKARLLMCSCAHNCAGKRLQSDESASNVTLSQYKVTVTICNSHEKEGAFYSSAPRWTSCRGLWSPARSTGGRKAGPVSRLRAGIRLASLPPYEQKPIQSFGHRLCSRKRSRRWGTGHLWRIRDNAHRGRNSTRRVGLLLMNEVVALCGLPPICWTTSRTTLTQRFSLERQAFSAGMP